MLIGMSVVFVGCEETSDYDFNAIEPIVGPIVGAGEVAAHGLTDFPTTYSVPHRGGSTFAWSVAVPGGGNSTIVLDQTYSSIAYITFPQSSVLTSATISVVETTMGGKTSPARTRQIVLTPFCPYDMDALVGNWTGSSGANANPVVATRTANLNELRLRGLAGFIQSSWGENWVSGDGSAVIEFICGDLIKIDRQQIGQTDYPDTYFLDGTGTYNPTTRAITLTYVVYYTGGNTAPITTTLTKQKMGEVEPFTLLK